MTSLADTDRRRSAPALGTFERYLTLWVALCIVAGIILGQLIPAPFHALGQSSSFANPVSEAQATLAEYFDSFFKCVSAINATTSPIKCGATAMAP